MASVLVRIIDSAGNIVEEKELQEYQIQVYRDFGFTVNYLNDNSLPTAPEPTQLSPEVQQIFDGIFEGTIIIPDWFRQSTMNYVKDGIISSEEFLNSYNHLVDTNVITFPFAPAPIHTDKVLVYNLDLSTASGFSTEYYPEATIEFQQSLLSQGKLYYAGDTHIVPSLEFIKSHYGYVEPEPELELSLWWATRPNGEVEQLNVTQNFVDTMTARGWLFSKEQPITPTLPENKDISVIFFTGTGGDLKTHFNIPEIIVTEAIHSELSSWLFQNYQATILASRNFSTDKPVTHSLEEIRNLIQQKIADDTPTPTPTTPKGKGFQFPSIVALTTGALALSLLLSGAKK